MPVGQSLDKGTADVTCELLEENHCKIRLSCLTFIFQEFTVVVYNLKSVTLCW